MGSSARGVITGHVDDFVFGGSAADKEWQGILNKIRQRFKWGDWELSKFVQCGVQVEKTKKGFELSQPMYVDSIKEIPLCSSRRCEEGSSPTTERERTHLRTLLGSLSWHAQQVAPHTSAGVSLLLSEVGGSTLETIIRANTLAYDTKVRKEHRMIIHKFGAQEDLGLFAWVEAASQNRCDGGSTQCLFLGMGPMSLLQGEMCRITPHRLAPEPVPAAHQERRKHKPPSMAKTPSSMLDSSGENSCMVSQTSVSPKMWLLLNFLVA